MSTPKVKKNNISKTLLQYQVTYFSEALLAKCSHALMTFMFHLARNAKYHSQKEVRIEYALG